MDKIYDYEENKSECLPDVITKRCDTSESKKLTKIAIRCLKLRLIIWKILIKLI